MRMVEKAVLRGRPHCVGSIVVQVSPLLGGEREPQGRTSSGWVIAFTVPCLSAWVVRLVCSSLQVDPTHLFGLPALATGFVSACRLVWPALSFSPQVFNQLVASPTYFV